jgi:hypothetical protein
VTGTIFWIKFFDEIKSFIHKIPSILTKKLIKSVKSLISDQGDAADEDSSNLLVTKLLENSIGKLENKLKSWKKFNKIFMENLENPPIPEDLQMSDYYSSGDKEYQLEQNLAYLRFNGLESLV